MIFYLYFLINLIITGLIVYLIIQAIRRRMGRGIKEKDWYLQIFLSKEDLVSQIFFLLSVFFFGITLLAFNKDLGKPLSERTILLLTSTIGLVVAYYFKVIHVLALSLIGFESWWYLQARDWTQENESGALLSGLLLIATLFYLLGRVHEKEIKFKRVSIVYSILGLIFITGILYFLSTKSGLRILEELTKGTSFFVYWQVALSLFILLFVNIGILVYVLSKNLVFKYEAIALGFLVALFFIIALLPEQTMFLNQYGAYESAELSSTGILWAVIFNILIFLELVGIIFLGYLKRENWLINLGTFFIFILIFFKYFDWFFTFLDKSIFFIGAGILLFVVGWFMERGRRYLLSAVKREELGQN